MVFVTFTLAVVAFCMIYYCFKNTRDYFKKKNIPYYPAWPLLGNMAEPLLRRKHVSHLVKDMYNHNPDAKYIGGFDFTKPVIMLRDLELINLTGERWKEVRNLVSPAFTSSKMKAMFELIVQCAKDFVGYLEERPAEDNKMIDTKDIFTRYANDAIATCAFGIKVDSMRNPNNEFYVYGREATNLESMMWKIFLARSFPKIMKLFQIKFFSDHIVNFFKNLVGSTVDMRDEMGINRQDLLQLMMDARGKDSKYKLDTLNMTAQIFTFFIGGLETTSTQLCIISHLLAIHPDVQKRLQNEIDEIIVKYKGMPTYEAIHGMDYLDGVYNESMRLHVQITFINRLCIKTFELPPALPGGKPFVMQPGMNVWIPVTGIHTDPRYYDDPETFNPERYYKKKVFINDVTNLGFGIGPRSCIGSHFAIMETKVLFFFLLSKFNLIANKKTAKPFVYSKHSISVVAEGGYWLEIEKRN